MTHHVIRRAIIMLITQCRMGHISSISADIFVRFRSSISNNHAFRNTDIFAGGLIDGFAVGSRVRNPFGFVFCTGKGFFPAATVEVGR